MLLPKAELSESQKSRLATPQNENRFGIQSQSKVEPQEMVGNQPVAEIEEITLVLCQLVWFHPVQEVNLNKLDSFQKPAPFGTQDENSP